MPHRHTGVWSDRCSDVLWSLATVLQPSNPNSTMFCRGRDPFLSEWFHHLFIQPFCNDPFSNKVHVSFWKDLHQLPKAGRKFVCALIKNKKQPPETVTNSMLHYAFLRPRNMFCAVLESSNMSTMMSSRWSVALIEMLCSAKNHVSLTSAVSSFSLFEVFSRHCVIDFCVGATFFFFFIVSFWLTVILGYRNFGHRLCVAITTAIRQIGFPTLSYIYVGNAAPYFNLPRCLLTYSFVFLIFSFFPSFLHDWSVS